MLRLSAGLTFSLLLAIGSGAACSSKSTDEGTGGKGGLLTAGSGGSAGTPSHSGSGSGGRTTGGGNGVNCEPISCLDDETVQSCDQLTGETDSVKCADEYEPLGFTSHGCTTDLDGSGCSIEPKDTACLDGMQAFAFCQNATEDEAFNIYVNCFQDNNGAKAVVTCYSKYVSETMMTGGDCRDANDNCLPSAAGGTGGGGGTGGTGGLPSDGGAGGAE